MMRHLVSNHIGRRKVTLCSKLLAHRCEKFSVEVGLFVRRAIERPRCAARISAWALRHTRVKHHNRRLISAPCEFGKFISPDHLSCRQNTGSKVARLHFLWREFTCLIALSVSRLFLQQRRYVDPREISNCQDKKQTNAANPCAPASAASAPPVFHIAASPHAP